MNITEGGPGTCEDYVTYKTRGAELCAQKNLILYNLEPGAMCSNGDGTVGIESATIVCCPPAPPPPPIFCSQSTDANGRICKVCEDGNGKVLSTDCDSPPGNPDPGMTCEKIDGGGDSTSCKTYDTWKQYGTYECNRRNMQLTELVTGPSCGGTSYQNAVYVCCGAGTGGSTGAGGSTGVGGSPGAGTGGASGQLCTTNRLSSGTCKPADVWKQEASAACAQQNLELARFAAVSTCNNMDYQKAMYVCCEPAP